MALSSGPPPSGVAVVRVSGPEADRVAAALGAAPLVPRKAALRTLTSRCGEVIDTALCLAFRAPASATGEDVVEFHCHGSPAVVERLIAEVVSLNGVRIAEPGEFTLRAVLSGKMGLADAEALADLIEARTEAERRRALRLAGGALTRVIAEWRARLIAALALCEAHIDFADESDVGDGSPQIDADVMALSAQIRSVLHDSRDADKLSDGYRVALVGAPNAGKSSLLNALARRSVALVSPEAGTTRDVVTATLDLGGFRVVIADTAGLRAAAEGIEAMGIARTRDELDAADCIIEVRSPDTTPTDLPRADLIVGHKSDIGPVPGAHFETTVANAASIDALAAAIGALAAQGLAGAQSALVTRQRQRGAIGELDAALQEALATPHLELKAEALRAGAVAIGRLTGEIDVEDILDDVFGRFCIGK